MWILRIVTLRNNTRKIQKDENGIIGLASYISLKENKDKYERRWTPSKNLKKVTSRKNHYKFKKNKVDEMINNQNVIKEQMENTYPDYILSKANCYYNEFNAKWYIQARMRLRKWRC